MLWEHMVPPSEVIRAILLDDSPCVLRILTRSTFCRNAAAKLVQQRNLSVLTPHPLASCPVKDACVDGT